MHIRKLDPEINPITLKDGRGNTSVTFDVNALHGKGKPHKSSPLPKCQVRNTLTSRFLVHCIHHHPFQKIACVSMRSLHHHHH